MALTSDNDLFSELYGTLSSGKSSGPGKLWNLMTGIMERINYVS